MRFVAVLVSLMVGVAPCPAQGLPAAVDHRARQSPVRDQGERSTCLAHAVVASLEAQGGLPSDLSEEHLHHQFVELNRRADPRFDGARAGVHVATMVNGYRGFRLCEERSWPYDPSAVETEPVPPAEAAADARVRVVSVERLRRPSIAALEGLLASGRDVVLEIPGDWDTAASARAGGLVDLSGGGRKGAQAGLTEHFLLAVGYDRARGVVIVKNSFGEAWGEAGYGYLTYRLVQARCTNALVVVGAMTASDEAPGVFLLGTDRR